jgi:membrane protease YdiL (CAAX protease family)
MNFTSQKTFLYLIVLPLLLISTTGSIFYYSASSLGVDWSYLIGFLFYWIVWCYVIPLILLKPHGFYELFKKGAVSIFGKHNWYLSVLLFATVIGALIIYFIPNVITAPLPVIILAIPLSIIAGTGEEILWRGLYIRSFPGNLLLSYLFPSIWFSVQHISSQLPEWSGESLILIASTLPLGLVYGLVAFKTNSIRWNALAHTIISFFGLAMPITTSIYNLLFTP